MDLQALSELKRGDSFLGASMLVQAVLSMQAVSYFPFKWRATVKKASTIQICYYLKYFTWFQVFVSYDSEQSKQN